MLNGKTAIVTGGGRDIGAACALKLAKSGAKVAVNYYNSAEGAEAVVNEINASGGSAFALQGDLTRSEAVEKLVAETTTRFEAKVDILVHGTGGILGRKKISEMSEEHWRRVVDLNVTSLFYLVQTALPHLAKGASIITFASQAGRDGGGAGAVAYAASKGAVMTMTRGLAKELAPDIRVNALCPGMIDTDFHNIFTKSETRQHVASITPLKREGTSEECADLVEFLASEKSSFITGACIDINGGLLFS